MALIDGITLAYQLDETSGTTVVDAHSTIDGTVNNNTINVAGKIGRANSFDKSQSDEYISLPQQSLSGDFTISWWDKGTTANMHIFVDKDNANVNNRIIYQTTQLDLFYGGAYLGGFAATIGNAGWIHRCLTRSGTTITYYESGSSVSTITSSATIIIDALYAHPDQATSITWGEGELDMFYLWVGTAKTSGEVSELYASGDGLAYPFSSSFTTIQIKLGGTFVDKPILTKVGGTFVDKPLKVKVGGTFQDA